MGIDEIFNQFDAPLRRYVARRIHDRAAVDDVLQEIYLKIHRGLDSLRNPERIAPWLYRIARNAIIDHYRRARPTEELSDDHVEVTSEDERRAFEERLRRSVTNMIDELPPIYREALTMSEIEGTRLAEVARRLGITLSGAKSRVQRGRRLLRKLLLDCCHFEFDRIGQVIDYYPHCVDCCPPPQPSTRTAPAR